MTTYLCFCLKSASLELYEQDMLGDTCLDVYKTILKFLHSHPSFKMSFSFMGEELEHYRHHHPELLRILSELINRKQVEILGGGYYSPVFPLLFPRDRTEQIEEMSLLIRQTLGKRPRGLTLLGSVWDASLVTSFSSSCMEYVFLDDSLIPLQKQLYVPLIMNDKGKSITILPFENSLKPSTGIDFQYYLDFIQNKIFKARKKCEDYYVQSPSVINIQIGFTELKNLIRSGWLSNFVRFISDNDDFLFALPQEVNSSIEARSSVYIPCGMSESVEEWSIKRYEKVKSNKLNPRTIFDFFQLYPEVRSLYDRMLYVSLLLNSSKGDRMRRKNARDLLLEAQKGTLYLCNSNGAFSHSSCRQHAYKLLNEAEKTARECEVFTESVSAFDYDSDGLNEYVCRMENFFASISRRGGMMYELEGFKSSGNYADSLSRVSNFDNFSDGYKRGLFVDHLLTEDEFQDYLESKPVRNPVLANQIYKEVRFSSQHKEISFETNIDFNGRIPVTLKKKYVLSSSGLMLQYIIRNRSEQFLCAKFCCESSFAQTNFKSGDFNAFGLEIITGGQKEAVDTKSSSCHLNNKGILTDVEAYVLTDKDNGLSFSFEPNEASNLCFFPLVFYRPALRGDIPVTSGMSFSNTIFWDVRLCGGMEMEKTINFSIFPSPKTKPSAI